MHLDSYGPLAALSSCVFCDMAEWRKSILQNFARRGIRQNSVRYSSNWRVGFCASQVSVLKSWTGRHASVFFFLFFFVASWCQGPFFWPARWPIGGMKAWYIARDCGEGPAEDISRAIKRRLLKPIQIWLVHFGLKVHENEILLVQFRRFMKPKITESSKSTATGKVRNAKVQPSVQL